jgi:hypothetical protein
LAKALNGTAFAGLEELAVFDAVAVGVRIFVGGVSVFAEGVYRTDVVVAFEPAEAEAEAEKDVAAPGPLVPFEAPDWT